MLVSRIPLMVMPVSRILLTVMVVSRFILFVVSMSFGKISGRIIILILMRTTYQMKMRSLRITSLESPTIEF